jgi:hypothetical protein
VVDGENAFAIMVDARQAGFDGAEQPRQCGDERRSRMPGKLRPGWAVVDDI